MQGEEVEVITSRGDKWLGGKDFDKELINLINEKYKKLTGKELDIDNNYSKYMEVAEQVKRVLSVRDKQIETVEDLMVQKK